MCAVIKRPLHEFGCEVVTAEPGTAAPDTIHGGERFDIIVLDWHMPYMDGLATAAHLRKAGHTQAAWSRSVATVDTLPGLPAVADKKEELPA